MSKKKAPDKRGEAFSRQFSPDSQKSPIGVRQHFSNRSRLVNTNKFMASSPCPRWSLCRWTRDCPPTACSGFAQAAPHLHAKSYAAPDSVDATQDPTMEQAHFRFVTEPTSTAPFVRLPSPTASCRPTATAQSRPCRWHNSRRALSFPPFPIEHC